MIKKTFMSRRFLRKVLPKEQAVQVAELMCLPKKKLTLKQILKLPPQRATKEFQNYYAGKFQHYQKGPRL